jgi:hypothetical protein
MSSNWNVHENPFEDTLLKCPTITVPDNSFRITNWVNGRIDDTPEHRTAIRKRMLNSTQYCVAYNLV